MRFRTYGLRRPIAALVIALALAPLQGCAGGTNPNATPQATIAHFAAPVIDSATALQKAVTSATEAKSIPVAIGQQITTINEKILDRGRQLSTALKAYEAATTLDLQKLKEGEVQAQIAAIQILLGEAFSIKIDNQISAQIFALIANIGKAVSTVAAEVAKVRG